MDKTQDSPDTYVTATQAVDGARVDERASENYYRFFGESYKGHYRGGLTGVAIGGLVGLAVGLAVCALPFVAGATAVASVIAAFTGIGSMMGAESLSSAGSASNSRAMGLAEKHARLSDPAYNGNDLAALDDKLMTDGRGYHYEYPPDRDKGKLYYAKSGLIGAAIAGTLGALLGAAGAAAEAFAPVAIVASHAAAIPLLGLLGPVGAMAAVGAIAFGTIGLSFGLDRAKVKSLFNHSDAMLKGTLHDGRPGPDLGAEQALGKETDAALAARRMQRQADITARGNEYGKKILKGTVGGKFRGYAGGAIAGSLIGGAAGTVLFGAVALVAVVTGAALPAVGLLGVLAAGFSAAGTLLGAKIFSEAGAEAGAEATARAIDDEFERNRILKSQGITPPPPEKKKEKWFSGKAALLCAAAGAVIGIPLAGTLGTGVLAVLGALHVAGVAHLAGTALVGAKLAASVATAATVGASFGNGPKTLNFFSDVADKIYEKSYHSNGTAFAESVAPQPVIETKLNPGHAKISAEDAAKLYENLSAANNGRSYVQTLNTQQMQPQAAAMQA